MKTLLPLPWPWPWPAPVALALLPLVDTVLRASCCVFLPAVDGSEGRDGDEAIGGLTKGTPLPLEALPDFCGAPLKVAASGSFASLDFDMLFGLWC